MKKFLLTSLFVVGTIAFVSAQKDIILVPFKSGNQWGYADTTGTVRTPAKYDKVEFCNDGRCKVYKDKLSGYLNMQGEEIVPVKYETCVPIGKYLHARYQGTSGVIDWTGRIIVPFTFDSISYLGGDKFYMVSYKGSSGVLKIEYGNAETVVPVAFIRIEYIWYKHVFMCRDAELNFKAYDEQGNLISVDPVDDDQVETIIDAAVYDGEDPQRYTIIQKNGKQGLIVSSRSSSFKNYGAILRDTIEAKYDSIIPDYNFNLVQIKKKWGVVDDNGVLVLQPEYDQINKNLSYVRHDKLFHDFYAQKKGKWGAVQNTFDANGKLLTSKVLIPFQYDSIRGHGRDYLVVQKGELFGVMSGLNYKVLTPIKYQSISKDWVYTMSEFDVFRVKDGAVENVYVGRNGVEFYSK